MYRFGWNGELPIEGGNAVGRRARRRSSSIAGSQGDYLKTMGIPLVQGRLFDGRDRRARDHVAVINHAMAEKFWPGQNPIGKRFGAGHRQRLVRGRRRAQQRALVRPRARTRPTSSTARWISSSFGGSMTAVVRTRADDPTRSSRRARQIVAAIDPALP